MDLSAIAIEKLENVVACATIAISCETAKFHWNTYFFARCAKTTNSDQCRLELSYINPFLSFSMQRLERKPFLF